MTTMNISLPESLKNFVDDQVSDRGFATEGEYIRELIRRDQSKQQLRNLLLEGANSVPGPIADDDYFAKLRARAGR